ncbi:hypothetical protein BOTNAR_0187g00040 [Botryotinia narcissicola]|uniref:Uncharacterized protein n=1 Tax=Botryotinia narcissicola TaxID=278944 RepID=A0A4Z1IN20_9HELO|nr:hypothetical protein BOTNAR_0187g00040 [Botryotinia narcissicola]
MAYNEKDRGLATSSTIFILYYRNAQQLQIHSHVLQKQQKLLRQRQLCFDEQQSDRKISRKALHPTAAFSGGPSG